MHLAFSILFLFLALSGQAAIFPSTLIDYHSGTAGQPLTANLLISSTYGTNHDWKFRTNGAFASADLPMSSLSVITNYSFTYPVARSIGGTNYITTGTKWASALYNNQPSMAAHLALPDGFSNTMIRGFIQFGITSTVNQVNFDLVVANPNPYDIIQQQTGPALNRIVPHSEGFTGVPFNISVLQICYFEMSRETLNTNGQIRFYDPTHFTLLSYASCPLTGTMFDADSVWLPQMNYLNDGSATGFTAYGGLSVELSDDVIPFYIPPRRSTVVSGSVIINGGVILQ